MHHNLKHINLKTMIIIHWDFTEGTELSYIEAAQKMDNFTTHCLDFFCFDTPVDDVIVLRKDGKGISRNNIQRHSSGKEIRPEHNLRKLLVAGYFKFL